LKWRWLTHKKICLSLVICLAVFSNACTRKSENKTEVAKAADPVRGRRIYLANCVACHNIDPSKDGSIGPAIKGASQVLLEAKVLTGKYPPGHSPKRKTLSMPLYSYLKSDIRHLEAYLATDSGKPSS
jgi:mono/diheme cytochrome c family protein